MKMTTRIMMILITLMAMLPTIRGATQCLLTGKAPKKASPSLVQCYRDNTSTCCNSLTDNYIKDQYSSLFTDSCARNYPVRRYVLSLRISRSTSALPARSSNRNTTTPRRIQSLFVRALWRRYGERGTISPSLAPSLTNAASSSRATPRLLSLIDTRSRH